MAESPRSIFELLGQAAKRVDLLLIGGFALQAYGVVRQTVDVDCAIEDANEQSFQGVLEAAGFRQLAHTENFARFRHHALGQLDILFLDAKTFSKMGAASRQYDVDEIVLRVPSLPHLVALKLHALKNDPVRELRDLSDVAELVRKNSFPAEELQKLCTSFGPSDIWLKLRPHL